VAGRVPLHPTENRGYRELFATALALRRHWSRLAARLPDPVGREALEAGAATARRLIGELQGVTAEHKLHGGPAALGSGARLADLRNLVTDPFLERNQALRMAVLDARHVRTLLAYLAAVGDRLGASERAAFCRRWEAELEPVERAVREAAIGLAADPDAAIEPMVGSRLGRAAHGASYAIGSVGEWTDRRAARRTRAKGS
jgi:hypothetical protein